MENKKTLGFVLLAAVFAISFYFRMQHFDHTIENPHSFRQAQTASNIHFFIQDGLSFECSTFSKNGPGITIDQYKLYDVPFYQWTVAILCKAFDTPIIQTGRAVNLFIFAGTFFSIFGIMRRCGVSMRCSLFTLWFFGLSPLNIYYSRAITPDNLAIFLGFLSLYCFLRWSENQRWRSAAFYTMIVAGVISTLIKSVIYLPIAFTIGLFFLLHRQLKTLFSAKMLTYIVIIGATAVFYRLFSNMINTGTLEGLKWENYWYFAKPGQRYLWASYVPIFRRFFSQVVPPAICTLFIAGVPLILLNKDNWRENRTLVSVMIGLAAGMILTVLTFLNVNNIHDYYQLPYVFIISFFAGMCLDLIMEQIDRYVGAYTHPGRGFAKTAVYALFILFTLQSSRLFHYAGKEPEHQIRPGQWLMANTPEDAFVIYVTPERTWDPTYLYLAGREGLYIELKKANRAAFQNAVDMFSDAYDEFYLFVPYYLVNHSESFMRDFKVTAHAPNAGYLVKLDD